MKVAKNMLLDFIREKGEITGDIITVEKFLNHKVNPKLIGNICEDILEKFKNIEYNKILTVESSGIVFASYLSFLTGKEFVFIKKKRPITMKDFYMEESYSFTKKSEVVFYLSKNVISNGDKFLFVDDFYANGNTYKSVVKLIDKAGAEITGSAVVINKSENKEIYSIIDKKDLREL